MESPHEQYGPTGESSGGEATLPPSHVAAGPAAPEFSPGDVINKRYLVQYRAAGGSNDVYLCLERVTWANVAVKFPRPHEEDKTGDMEWRTFQEEVRNWADLRDHPNVVKCLYAGKHERRWFLVLEWVGAPEPGKDLHAFLDALSDADPDSLFKEIIRLAVDVCDGLTYIHAKGIVHGDLKPSNILVDNTGRAKITDLGAGSRLAEAKTPRRAGKRMTSAHTSPPAGTPPYMAPELWEGRPASVQTDIYALGCLLYELAAGRRPFEAGDPEDTGEWIRLHKKHQPPRTPALPEQFSHLIADCLNKNPARRPATAQEVRERLARLVSTKAVDGPSATTAGGPDDGEEAYPELPENLSQFRMSLMSAAGRTADAIEQMNIAIRDEMRNPLTHAGKYVSDEPSPNLALSFNDRGALVGTTREWIRGADNFITAIRLNPRLAAAYANLGITYHRLNCPTLAIVAFNRAIELDPEDHRLYLRRARFLASHSWITSAHDDYKRAVTIAPDDPDACYGMADSLAALGRDDEVFQYRSKGLQPGHSSDEALEYLRPTSLGRYSEVLAARVTAYRKSDQQDHEAAIAAYSAALKAVPWQTDVFYYRAEARLAAGDASGAIDDLDFFLAQASTTHPQVPKARDSRRRARETIGSSAQKSGDPGEGTFPLAKSSSYIALKTQGIPQTAMFINWLPLKPAQRLTLLDMLYSGDPDRGLSAEDLLWNAFGEDFERRSSQYEEILRNSAGDAARDRANGFTQCEISGELAVKNGFGIPVLLTEVEVSPNPLRDVRFSNSAAPSLGWASSGAVGVWEVLPGIQTDHMIFDEPRQAPLFTTDGSSYLLVGKRDFCVRRVGEQGTAGLTLEDGSILAGCFHGVGGLAVGLSSGSVAFIHDPMGTCDVEDVQLTHEDIEELGLWQSGDGEFAAFAGGVLYQVLPRQNDTDPQIRQLDVPFQTENVRLMAGCGSWALWAVSEDELFLTRLHQPDANVRLTAPDSTDEGFMAAAVSSDGSIVAAVCGSFLHVWRALEDAADYEYLPMTPQPWGRCIAVSRDGMYIAVGTTAGSVLIYTTRIAGES
jgi:serine/threonine protein kinase